tara:strand:+ start:79 stop:759 length:681 start_codon:yes stop_codon:yes gene_type:complete
MHVDYDKQTVNAKNFFARYAHRSRLKISENIIQNLIYNEKITILDYGCGDGNFLNNLSKKYSNCNLIGYDPYSTIVHKLFKLCKNLDQINNNSLDIVCCFETLEHLDDNEFNFFINSIKNKLKTDGKLIVSVPIIGGLTLILKEINRAMMFKRKSDYSFKEFFLASFFNKSPKRPDNIKTSHKGFNFQLLENKLRIKLNIKSKILSPFKHAPWFLNSTILYVLEFK